MTRVERLAAALEEPLLVTAPANVRYLSGLSSSNAAVLVEPGEGATLFTDFRYSATARELGQIPVVETRRDLVAALGERLAGRRLAFEANHLTYADFERLSSAGVELVASSGLIERLRAVKDADELAAIRRAATISDRVFEALARERFSGRSERELAWWIEQRFHDLGAEGTAFPALVAAGPNGARPHAVPGDTPIRSSCLVIVDTGCTVAGYCSDCTRTFATGVLSERLAEAYELCLRAQHDALAVIRAGTGLRAADAASRTAIAAAGLAEHYGHGLGHGVGLEVHEAPTLRPDASAESTLEAGNVVTVEPGIYLPGIGGVRIEDLVLVTDEGPDRLTTITKDLIVVE